MFANKFPDNDNVAYILIFETISKSFVTPAGRKKKCEKSREPKYIKEMKS